MASTTRLTIEDYERLPAEQARGHELVDGELVEEPGRTLANNLLRGFLRKKDRYRRCGTREVWIISQDSQEIYVYSDHGNRILTGQSELTTDLIPGFSIRVAELLRYESS